MLLEEEEVLLQEIFIILQMQVTQEALFSIEVLQLMEVMGKGLQ